MADSENTAAHGNVINITPVDRIRKLVGDEFQGWKDRQIEPGIAVVSCLWSYAVEGRKSTLIAHGLAEDSWFASGLEPTKRKGRFKRLKSFEAFGRRIETRTYKNTEQVLIYVNRTDEEQENIRQQWQIVARAQDREKEADERKELEARLAETEAKKTPQEWIADKLELVDAVMRVSIRSLSGHGHKRAAEDDVKHIKALWHELRSAMLEARVLTTPRASLRVVK